MKTIKETYKENEQRTDSGVTETRQSHSKLKNKCIMAEEDEENVSWEFKSRVGQGNYIQRETSRSFSIKIVLKIIFRQKKSLS